MVVHLGVVVIGVGLAASLSYGHRAELSFRPGQTVSFEGHTLTYLGAHPVSQPNRRQLVASVRVDGAGVFKPALSQFGSDGQAIGTPAIDSGFSQDVYLSLDSNPQGSRVAVIGVVVQSLVSWLWVGGGLMAVGTVMAAAPGRRRRPTEPASLSPELVLEHQELAFDQVALTPEPESVS